MQTLGELIEKTRSLKHMTVSDLTKQVGVSQASYNRMRHDQADLKLTTLLALLDALRLDVCDCEDVLRSQYFQGEQWQIKIEACATAIVRHQQPSSALMTLRQTLLQAHLIASSRTLLLTYLDLLQAKISDQQIQAAHHAQKLWQLLAQCSRWHQHEYQLFLPVITYLSWPQLKIAYTRYFGETPQAGTEALLNDEYLAMLAHTLQNQTSTQVGMLCEWCQTRAILTDNVDFLVVKQFCQLIEKWLAGCQDAAKAGWATLQKQVQALQGANKSATLVVLQRLWPAVLRLSATSGQASVVHPSPPADRTYNLVTLVANLRQAKQVPVTMLYQSIYLSKAAYYRQFGQVEHIRTNEFFMALDCLRLQCVDLEAAAKPLGMQVITVQRALQQDVAAIASNQKPHYSLKQWADQLSTWAKTRQNVGYSQLRLWLKVVQAEQADQSMQAATAALQLYQQLIRYEGWTAFEYGLLLPILPYLPFAQGQYLFAHFLTAQSPTTLLGVPPSARTLVYLGLLESALAGHCVKDLQTALTWIKQRVHAPLQFGVYQRLAECLLADDNAAYQALLTNAAAICGPNTCAYLQVLWQQAQGILHQEVIA